MNATEGDAPTARFIGSYRVVALIGVGASSTVYRAVRPADGLQVAVKLLADNHSVVPESRRRFADEARVMTSIMHPAIAEVYEVGETEAGQPYIVMELADRGDLRARVEELEITGQPLTVDDIRAVALHLAEGLSALHDHDVIHRDLSPGNLLIRNDRSRRDRPPMASIASAALIEPGEKLLLADLGFAKILEDGSGLTRGGGTPGFQPPEQRGAVSQVDHRADVYSATAIIDWLAHQADLTDRIGPFLATGMADDPAERHDDMATWFAELDGSLRADDDAPSGPGSSSRAEPRRRQPVLAVAAGVAALVVVAVAWVFVFRSGDASDTVAAADGTAATGDQAGTADADAAAATPESDLDSADDADPARLPQPASPGADGATPTTGASEDETSGAAATTASSTAPDGATTSTPATSTTSSSSTSVTTASASTTSNPFPFSPRAYISTPTDGSAVSAPLRIVGTAEGPVGGIELVQLTVRRQADATYWDPDRGEFTTEFVRFDVPVDDPGGADVNWSYEIDAGALQPGAHRLRVWGRGADGSGDPVGTMIIIDVTG